MVISTKKMLVGFKQDANYGVLGRGAFMLCYVIHPSCLKLTLTALCCRYIKPCKSLSDLRVQFLSPWEK